MEQPVEVVNPTPLEPVPPAPVVVPQKSHFFNKLLLVLVILGVIFGGAFFYLTKMGNPVPGSKSEASPAPSTSAYIPPASPDKSMLYLVDPDRDQLDDLEPWLITASGQVEKLELPAVREAYKYYGDPRVFYIPAKEENILVVKNLASGQEDRHTLVTHPDPQARELVSLQHLGNISPDGKYLVFYADFFTPCPSPSPFASGFEGGYGPCMPDESLETPIGYYLYDLSKRKATNLKSSDLLRVERWDTAGEMLYYAHYSSVNVSYKISLTSLTSSMVDTSSSFGYFYYPLFKDKLGVKHESATSPTAFGKNYLQRDGQPGEILAEESGWAVLQPFLTSSPDERYLLWLKTTLINGLARNAIYYYDRETQKTGRLTPEGDSVNFHLYLSWLDDHTLVTAGDPVEESSYNSDNQYLLKIDLSTGQATRLGEVTISRFNVQ